MNNFTKEELEQLLFYTELHKNKYQIKHPQELINKIQSMIENYCEHDWISNQHEQPTYCSKCNNEKQKIREISMKEAFIDWELNMANSIASQIINNEHCKKEYARILAIASLKISDALRYENDNQ